MHRDHVMLAVLLAQVKLRGIEEISDELEFLMESGDGAIASSGAAGERQIAILSIEQMQRLESFAKQALFKPVITHITDNEDQWVPFLESDTPELVVPYPWERSTRAYCQKLFILFTNISFSGRRSSQENRDCQMSSS